MLDYINRYGAYIVVYSIRRYGPYIGGAIGVFYFLKENIPWGKIAKFFSDLNDALFPVSAAVPGDAVSEMAKHTQNEIVTVAPMFFALMSVLIGLSFVYNRVRSMF